MRFPQATERIKEAPAHALRAVFAGIGQIMLVTDRIRRRPSESGSAPQPPAAQPPAAQSTPAQPASSAPPASAPADQQKSRSLDQTGNVRVLAEADEADEVSAEQEPAAAQPEAAEPVTAVPAPEPEPAAAAAAQTGGAPLPNYQDLSIASLRARMRGLDLVQMRALVVYERTHAGRADVIAMFERRIAKL